MEDLIRQMLVELGEDPEREGLLKTPERVEKSLRFLTRGLSVCFIYLAICSISLYNG